MVLGCAEDSGQSVLSSLESHILPLVPALINQLVRGIRVLNVGCGRGPIITKLPELLPQSHVTGMDLSQEAIAFARREASNRGMENTKHPVYCR
jgi:2-polyprenyl-3-methyl-5-hydroxy-6-metoxy-1,4-benzoquinol methylase